jgi:hypothetical protein
MLGTAKAFRSEYRNIYKEVFLAYLKAISWY